MKQVSRTKSNSIFSKFLESARDFLFNANQCINQIDINEDDETNLYETYIAENADEKTAKILSNSNNEIDTKYSNLRNSYGENSKEDNKTSKKTTKQKQLSHKPDSEYTYTPIYNGSKPQQENMYKIINSNRDDDYIK